MARDSRNNVVPGTIDVTGYEMIVTENGKRKKGKKITRTLTNPEDIAVFISNTKDALKAASDYQEGNDYTGGGTSKPPATEKGLLD